MADNDQYNDEYQLTDPDAPGPELEVNQPDYGAKAFKDKPANNANKVRRNALIAVAVFFLFMLLYKIFSAVFTSKDQTIKPVEVTSVTTTKNSPEYNDPEPITVIPETPTLNTNTRAPVNSTSSTINVQMERQLTALQSNQQSMQTQVATMTNQLNSVNHNVGALLSKMAELNQIIEKLHTQVDLQSHEIVRLTEHARPKRPKMIPVSKTPVIKYYLQAVIPGRAWLIATNGTTLTVREGTLVQGYGVVKLIDPSQGMVLTSSGQVIKFSQEDS